MKKTKIISYLLIVILLIIQIHNSEIQRASAAMKIGNMITITEPGQVIDSITYNGITVEAVYTYESYASNDTTYCCAAFIKKFYSKVYDISVYNLNSTSSTPLVYNSKGSFRVTASPQVGDIIRDNKRTHWAIVKEINGNIITAIQQSYKTGNTAFVNCTIDVNDSGFSYFTYSNRIDNSPASDYSDSNLSLDAYLQNGTYNIINLSSGNVINSKEFSQAEITSQNWLVTTEPYDNSYRQILQIAMNEQKQYSLQFLSDKRYLSVPANQQIYTAEKIDQYYVLTDRGNSTYTISPAGDTNKVLAENTDTSEVNSKPLVLQNYTGAGNQLWYFNLLTVGQDQTSTNQSSMITIPTETSADTSIANDPAAAPDVIPSELSVPVSLYPEVTLSKKTLYIGFKSYTLKFTGVTENSLFSFRSSDTSVAKINEKGKITPVSEGVSCITVKIIEAENTYQYNVTVTVKKPYIKLTNTVNETSVGEISQFSADIIGMEGTITWSTSDETIAKIDSKTGKLSGIKKGTVTVIASCNGIVKAAKKVKIV
jgi:hypothetical protein